MKERFGTLVSTKLILRNIMIVFSRESTTELPEYNALFFKSEIKPLWYKKRGEFFRRWLLVLLIMTVGLMQFCSKQGNPVVPPGPVEKNIQFTGAITGTFSGRVLSGAKVRVEIEGQNAVEGTTDGAGRYSVVLKYVREPGKLIAKVTFRISGAGVRFVRESSYEKGLMSDIESYDINCIENTGDGTNFDLKLYRKLNSYTDGNPFPTMRWYPGFPEVYIVKTADISNEQYQQVKEGIAKISQYSRGAIPLLIIKTVTDEPNDRTGKIIHKWVPDNQLPGNCAATDATPFSNYSIGWSIIKYKGNHTYCSAASFHEMMHAMMNWPGLDRTTQGEISDYQKSVQIFFDYKRFPGHTFESAIDKDSKTK